MSGFFMGTGLGIILMAGLISLPGSAVSVYNNGKDACELNLPRNQQCEILFLPKQVETKA